MMALLHCIGRRNSNAPLSSLDSYQRPQYDQTLPLSHELCQGGRLASIRSTDWWGRSSWAFGFRGCRRLLHWGGCEALTGRAGVEGLQASVSQQLKGYRPWVRGKVGIFYWICCCFQLGLGSVEGRKTREPPRPSRWGRRSSTVCKVGPFLQVLTSLYLNMENSSISNDALNI